VADLNLSGRDYALLTLHRPSNVDQKDGFEGILDSLTEIAGHMPIVFPARKMIDELGLGEKVEKGRPESYRARRLSGFCATA